METASYRIASDGAFIHRAVRNQRYGYFFRERAGNGERPYAAEIRLPRRIAGSGETVRSSGSDAPR